MRALAVPTPAVIHAVTLSGERYTRSTGGFPCGGCGQVSRAGSFLAGSMTDSAGSFLFDLDMLFEEGSAQTCLFLLCEVDNLQLADLPLSHAVRQEQLLCSGSAVAGCQHRLVHEKFGEL